MGCCISKCQPKPKLKPYPNIPSVQDKLVISKTPPCSPPSPPRKRKTIQSPPSITSASLTCSTTQTNTCCSSSLSSASSSASIALFSKVDHSFSNDFLHTCAMENPQVVGLDHIKKSGEVKKLSPGTTQKRARATSPTITRQKSFRAEKVKPLNTIVTGRINTMRSPSPSRRFNKYTSSSYQRQPMLVSRNIHNESNRTVKAYSQPASPYRNVIDKERPVYLKNKDRFGYEVDSKVEKAGVGQVLSKKEYSEPVPMEDLDNPHIALDCFIFL